MLTLQVNGKKGVFDMNLPTSINEITPKYIEEVTNHIKVNAEYSLIGLIFREKLSTLLIAARKSNKKSDISVIPIFVKAGETNSKFISGIHVMEKLIIAPSDIMIGHHVSTPLNLLTINTFLDLTEGDSNLYNKMLTSNEYCHFIEFKLVPNCAIHGSYDPIDTTITNPFINKIKDADKSNLIDIDRPKVIV